MNTQSVLQTIVATIVYILVSWAKDPVDEVFALISGDNGFIRLISNAFDFLSNKSNEIVGEVKGFGSSLVSDLKPVLESVDTGLDYVVGLLKQFNTYLITNLLAKDTEHVGQRIFGALLQLLMLPFFIYADITQGWNSISELPGIKEFPMPVEFQNLAIPIVIASVGSMFALAIVLFDLLGVTHFAPWDKLSDKWRKIMKVVVILTMVASSFSSMALAFSRFPEYANLPSGAAAFFKNISGFAQSFVIFPMLITTALLFWGIFGLLVFAIVIVALLMVLVKAVVPILHFLFFGFQVVLFLLFIIISILFFVLQYSFMLLSGIFVLTAKLITLVHRVVDLVSFPGRQIIGWVSQMASRSR